MGSTTVITVALIFFARSACGSVWHNSKGKNRQLDLSAYPHTKCTSTTCKVPDDSLRFFLIGDWGGLPTWPYVTHAQKKVAKAMGKIGDKDKTHFQLALGDNVYIVGLQNERDDRLYDTFEKVYKSDSLQKPWYILAGNHDHYGNVSLQIDYTEKSKRWVFPSLYYTIKYQLSNGVTVDIINIDTTTLCGNTREGRFKNFFEYLWAQVADRKAQGPSDPAEAEKHWNWIQDELANSEADYLFVAGHYPVYSVGEHGPTQCLVDRLNPLLKQHKVNAYFSGHDHNMQHCAEPLDDGFTVHHVLSGSGAYELKSSKNEDAVPAGINLFRYPDGDKSWTDIAATVGLGKGAFVYANVGQNEATFRYVLGDSSEPYSFTLKPRK